MFAINSSNKTVPQLGNTDYADPNSEKKPTNIFLDCQKKPVTVSVAANKNRFRTKAPNSLDLSKISNETVNQEDLELWLNGMVRKDPLNPNFVIKEFSNLFMEMAEKECTAFKKFYGENSAEMFARDGKVMLRMTKILGKPLSKCMFSELPRNSLGLFLKMLLDLADLKIIHGDLSVNNILYDAQHENDDGTYGIFRPINIINNYEEYLANPSVREPIDMAVKTSVSEIMQILPLPTA